MKKQNILNLIKYHSEDNEIGFKTEAYEIAKCFEAMGDRSLAHHIMMLISRKNALTPQSVETDNFIISTFLQKVPLKSQPNALPLPEDIFADIEGIINAVGRFNELNKFLFYGPAGTGKTESVKEISKRLARDLYIVNYSQLIDSRLGQTAKNISDLFVEINNYKYPNRLLILFDELDALALDRTNSNDVREMGRVTSTLLTCLDGMDPNVLLIATTNLYEHMDKAFLRRFDATVDFSRYSKADLIDVAEVILQSYLTKFPDVGRNVKLFRKIMELPNKLPYPGDIKNIIKSSLGFSNPSSEFDYMRRIYLKLTGQSSLSLSRLNFEGFTLREIEILTGVSKSNVARKLKEIKDE